MRPGKFFPKFVQQMSAGSWHSCEDGIAEEWDGIPIAARRWAVKEISNRSCGQQNHFPPAWQKGFADFSLPAQILLGRKEYKHGRKYPRTIEKDISEGRVVCNNNSLLKRAN